MEERPVLYPDLIADYQAFCMLSSSRQSGFAASPILISEILAYMQMFEINEYTQKKTFMKRIKLMDQIYLKFVREEKNAG